MRRWPRLVLAAMALLATGLACRDAVGPGARMRRAASLSIAAPPSDLIAPDGSRLEVDNGIVRITRADGTVVLERPFAFPAGQQSVSVELDIPLNAPTEQFTAGIQLRNGQTLLFQTSGPITVSFGNSNPAPQLPALTYAGPGATVTSLTLAPRDTVLTFGDSVRFRSTALAGQQAVSAYFVNLVTSDAQVPVQANGFVRAPSRRASITVTGTVFGTSVTDQTTVTFVPRPTAVALAAGNGQTATVGTTLPTPLRVRVTAADGFGVSNVPVSFATTTPGASVATAVVRTDANGLAETVATLGPGAGAQQFSATVTGLTPANFTATATPGALASVVFTTAPPATVRAEAPFAITVQGRDANGNATALPTPVTVAFGTRPGIATLGGVTSVTPAGAQATFSALRASRPGTGGTLVVTAGAITATSSAFAVTVGAVATVSVVAGTVPSSAVVGTTLADSLVWRAADDLGVPVGGVTMTFALSDRVGSVVRGSATTDTTGRASPGPWTLATTAGRNALTAAVGVVQGPGIFVDGTAAGAATVAASAGNGQSAAVNSAVATAPRVLVTDANGNPVSGVTVAFAVTGGGGSVTGASAVTDAAGLASVGSWTLGTLVGANTLSATVGALTPVTFTATATPGAPSVLEILAPAGGTQTGATGQAVATPPSVRVRDAFANVVPGVTVTFAVTGGGGSVTGETVVTDAAGIATVGSWTLGAAAGTNTLRATAGTLTVDFTATTAALVATVLRFASPEGVTVRAGQAIAQPIQLFAETATGVRVPGTSIAYGVIGANGQEVAGTAGFVVTDASGIAALPSFVVSTEPGFYLLRTFSPSANASTFIQVTGDPAGLSPVGPSTLTVAAGAPFPAPLQALVFDVAGGASPGAAVTVTRSAVDAVGPAAQTAAAVFVRTSDALGEVSFTETAPTVPGTYTYRMSVDGESALAFTVRVTGPAVGTTRVLGIVQGDGQRTAAGTAPAQLPRVRLTDLAGTVAVGETITFQRVDPLGVVTAAGSAVTDANGEATLPGPYLTSTTPGLNQVVATASGAQPSIVGIAGYGAVAVLLRERPASYPIQAPGTIATPAPQVRAVDLNGTPVPGVTLTVTTAQPGPLGSPVSLPVRTVTTDAEGRASVPFPIGTLDGLNTLTFSIGTVILQFLAQGVTPG